MKHNFATLLLIAGIAAAPLAAYSADSMENKETMKEKATEAKTKVKRVSKDTSITTKVKASFAKDTDVSAMRIHVKTKHGVVRLTGKAKSAEESSKAEDIAKNIEGVKSVKNDIKVAAAK